MKAVILAGGLGTRLKPFTQVIPKPLLPIGEKSVLEIQLERLKKYGFDTVYFATNYKSNYVENFFGDGSRYGINIKYSKEDKPLGTAGPLTLIKSELTEPFLVMNGDILTLLDFSKFYDFAIKNNEILTIGIKKEITPFAFGNIFFEGDKVTGIQEKPNIEMYILAGIYVMRPEIFNYIPENTMYGMDELILNLLDKNIRIIKYEIEEYWLDIGRISDYERANEFYNKHIEDISTK